MVNKEEYKISNQPVVSFILPVYKGKWLKQAIDSILDQSYKNIELVIVNDQSPDDIDGIVNSYTDTRISYYKNEKNIGGKHLTKQWEHCISFANGEYLVIAADDDVYHPAFAEECIGIAGEYPGVDIIRARTEQIDENNSLIGVDNLFPKCMSQIEYTFRYRDGSAFICMGNFMFKTSVIKHKGFVDFPMAFGSDIATSIIMAENGIANTENILFSFRQSTIHLSGSNSRPKEKLAAITQFYNWIMNMKYKPPANEYEDFFLKHISQRDWQEKRTYDYYNQVIKHLPVTKLTYIFELPVTFKTKTNLLMRYFKAWLKL